MRLLKTLIVYCSNHGFSEKCANILKEKLGDNTDLANLKSKKVEGMDEYDTIIIGGSIHAGKIQKQLKQFLSQNENFLMSKKIGLYLCCADHEKYDAYFESEIPQSILNNAFIKVHLGHAYYMDKLNFMFKAMIKKFANIEESQEKIRYDQMDLLLDKINSNN